jgi:hypothetical protein
MKLLGVQEVVVMHNNLMKQRTLTGFAVLLAVFRYINSNSFDDELLFCKPMKNRITV